jgi:hypothetical protein
MRPLEARARGWDAAVCTLRRHRPQLPRADRHVPATRVRSGTCRPTSMGIGKAVVAGVGAKMLTGSLIGFLVVFALLYWLLGGF